MQYESGIRWPSLTVAVKWLLIANTAVFVAQALIGGPLLGPGGFLSWLGASTDNLFDGFGLGLLRLVSYQFVHSFTDPMHFLVNMLVLYMFGTMVEGAIGRDRLLALYLFGGLVGAGLELGLAALLGNSPIVVGASGACYGIMVYAACLMPHASVIFIVFPMQLWVLAALLVALGAYQLYVNLLLGGGSGVAHGCHLGGALWGYLSHRYRLEPAGWLADWRARSARRRVQQAAAQVAATDQEVDRLLDKVHREGLNALTPAERAVLDRRSKEMRRR